VLPGAAEPMAAGKTELMAAGKTELDLTGLWVYNI